MSGHQKLSKSLITMGDLTKCQMFTAAPNVGQWPVMSELHKTIKAMTIRWFFSDYEWHSATLQTWPKAEKTTLKTQLFLRLYYQKIQWQSGDITKLRILKNK